MYPEANYGPNLDIYSGKAPYGLEIEGKKMFKGFKLAMGPELWWGANPAILLKYSKTIGKFVRSKVRLTNAKQNKNDNFLFDIGLIFNKTFLNGVQT